MLTNKYLKKIYIVIVLIISFSGYAIDVKNYKPLTSDNRAFRVGETLVVLVTESTKAESSAGTGVTKGVSVDANADDGHNNVNFGLGFSGTGEGEGRTVRNGMASTQVSAVITQVLNNNMVEIHAHHELVINGEKQTVIISGLARIHDISKNNTLISNRIANARIEIQGVGDITEAQEQSIFFKVFKWLGIV